MVECTNCCMQSEDGGFFIHDEDFGWLCSMACEAQIRLEYRTASIIEEIKKELLRGDRKHGDTFFSLHEGISVVREEFEETWDEVKADNPENARKEALQLAAMAIKFIRSMK